MYKVLKIITRLLTQLGRRSLCHLVRRCKPYTRFGFYVLNQLLHLCDARSMPGNKGVRGARDSVHHNAPASIAMMLIHEPTLPMRFVIFHPLRSKLLDYFRPRFSRRATLSIPGPSRRV